MTAPDELLAAARLVEDKYPGAAAELRALAPSAGDPDPRQFRRAVLRRIWRTHHFGMTRTAAARLIAAEWRAWADSRGDELPGSLGDAFARLERAGVSPVSRRTLVDDLDQALD